MMIINPIKIIEKKRDGGTHTRAEIEYLVKSIMSAEFADYQLSAWLMAVYLNGLTEDETIFLTEALAFSGEVFKYSDDIKIVDKHSTGGVGDKTSLILIPLVASCGGRVSKLSGSGLGYTGGTVDKFESITNMKLNLSQKDFKRQVEELGCAISGHSTTLAPAEVILYKLRDVTGTVPSIPLITSSIISKKIAGGAMGFVFDVKFGSGAFMQNKKDAQKLAKNLVATSQKMGKKCTALITNMNQPLGEFVGNSAEIYEAIKVLSGEGPKDTKEICLALGANMLKIADVCETVTEGYSLCEEALNNGKALLKFRDLIKAQGGDASIVTNPNSIFPLTKYKHEIKSNRDGFISKLDAQLIGEALRSLGGGRMKKEDSIDSSVAIRLMRKIGCPIFKNDTVLEVYYNNEKQIKSVMPYLPSCFEISPKTSDFILIADCIS